MISRKPKKCKVCKAEYWPMNSPQKACSPECALHLVRVSAQKKQEREARERQKRVRANDRKRKEALKGKPELTREAQQAFNKYIRARDRGKPCISCGRYPDDSGLITGSKTDCGHYRSVGSMPSLRFEPLNCASQCVYCNRHLSGNIVEYRKGLLERIGPEKLEWLEGPHPAKNYTRDELREIRDFYRKEARELERCR